MSGFCPHRMMELCRETVAVPEALRASGFTLGVISDIFPSLEFSLESLGLACYFDSSAASSLVGASKPDPRIFEAADRSLGVKAESSIFVDGDRENAEGAREQGFTAFCLDRVCQQADVDSWTVESLERLLDCLKLC